MCERPPPTIYLLLESMSQCYASMPSNCPISHPNYDCFEYDPKRTSQVDMQLAYPIVPFLLTIPVNLCYCFIMSLV